MNLKSVFAALLFWGVLAAAQVRLDPQLQKAIAQRAEAERTLDITTFSRLTTDDFTLTNQKGKVLTKSDRIAQLKASQPSGPAISSDEQIRTYGNTALRLRRVVREGKPLRMITVWVKERGQWKVAATQVTPEQN